MNYLIILLWIIAINLNTNGKNNCISLVEKFYTGGFGGLSIHIHRHLRPGETDLQRGTGSDA